ncbi:ATP-dependent Clp protease adaptor ClpS [Bradyrhizobium sp. i1.15.2]|uniref:ATP-dependent Clp protease adaptor ClpS n=1 Tax=Bradyrhizobium sp. i1.15.2 TaxID=3156362 RepID=UPI0033961A74
MRGENQPTQLVIHNDDDTPDQFVMDLLRQVFGKSDREATALITQIEQKEKAVCGPYPQSVAEALFKSAQQSIGLAGHRLQVTLEAVKTPCELCGKPEGQMDVRIGDRTVWLCSDCMRAADEPSNEQEEDFDFACDVLDWHLASTARSKLVTTIRQFPGHMRVDLQAAVDRLFGKAIRLVGLNEEQRYETLSIPRLLKEGRYAIAIAPLQYSDVDVGEKSPVKCLDNGLWLCEQDHLRYAVLLCAHREYSREPEFESRSWCLQVPQARLWSSNASVNWKKPYRLRGPIAARSCRSMRTPTIAVARAASRCIACRRCRATR